MKPPIEAVYKDGALRPVRAIDLPEGGRFLVTLESLDGSQITQGDSEGSRDVGDAILKLAGCLRGSEMCSLDPLDVQHRLRDEWS
jgi:predicted DNA-binding antitoxin AbrB/MazE fold protein